MSSLHIALFGVLRLTRDGQSLDARLPGTARTLLAYLLLRRPHIHPRDVLADLLWGDRPTERAHGSLNTALWRLRRLLEPDGVDAGTYLVATPAGQVGFNWASDHWLDVTIFERETTRILVKPTAEMDGADARDLENAITLYTGDLLVDVYDDWALAERERLRSHYLSSLTRLMHYYSRNGLYDKGIAYGQEILRYDHLHEEVHRELIRLYCSVGQRALAIRQFETCRAILAEELGVAPMEETQALYEQLALNTRHDGLTANVAVEAIDLEQALQRLTIATQQLGAVQEQLQRAIQLVERLAQHYT